MHLADITMFYAAKGGGVSTYLNAKAAWLAGRSRVRHTIFSPNVRGQAGPPTLVQLPGLALPGLHGYRTPLPLAAARALQRRQPDLIEAGDAGPAGWAAVRVKRRLGIPAVAFYHSDLAQLVGQRFGNLACAGARRYLRQLYRQFDLVLAPSRRIMEQLDGMGVHDVVHQPLGIDAGVFTARRRVDTLRQHLQLPAHTRLLVYAGRFTPEKKLPLLLDAVHRLGPPYHLLLIGGAVAMPRQPRVTHLPFMCDQGTLAHLLASCDVLVHPGDHETFGLVVLEAMACGLPVVAACGGGVAELVDDATGMLVAPNSVAALCEGIAAVYTGDLAAMAQAAAHKARTLYDWNRIMPQLMQRYAGLLASHARADLEAEGICATD